ncbi:MAG TPA: CocE/NonD family hydrolase, partial [Burkholderiaceae bacterium]
MVANVQAVARSLLWMCTVLASTVASVAWAAGTEPAADPRAPTPQASTPLPLLTPKSYLESLATFKTHLIRNGPSPQPYRVQSPPPGVREVIYPSGPLSLKAWVAFPEGASAMAKVPAVVFFHGGYAFGAGDFEDARPFLQAGFAVMCPMLRGEDGNPGDFEMLLGEVDDASAAIAWMASQPGVDPSHVYTFGHSAGGIISALLSLRAVPIRHGGSSGGLYGTLVFDIDWVQKALPFADSPDERAMRVLVGNVRWMQRRHYAYVGSGDPDQEVTAASEEVGPGSLLVIEQMPGDHFTSLPASVKAYI